KISFCASGTNLYTEEKEMFRNKIRNMYAKTLLTIILLYFPAIDERTDAKLIKNIFKKRKHNVLF
ncbi:MAG TPA: hypothetical protein VD908_14150, partial [Cytophagales bacterium]|nr:hypothetical protein [Cytophagales bacterium]